MSADSVVSIAWDVFKIMFVPIKHRFEYVTCSKRYADGLRKEVENLEQEADRVGRGAERATRNVEDTEKWVKKFLESAKEASKEAKDLLGEFENMSKTCCRGTLPDPICRYRFSRKAKHTTDGIKNLILDIGGKEISAGRPAPGDVAAWREGKDVVQPTMTASISSASTSIKLGDDNVFGSRAMIIRAVMDALANNSNSVVGVYGMGGVGKSTLLEEVKMIISKENFDWVTKANVSENPDIKTIQGEIADALDLGDIKEKETLSGRAELLRSRLEKEMAKKKVLIILDNLWTKLDLKSVGIPCGPDNKVKGCKLLLTSRYQLVLRRDMGCDKDFLLPELEKEEAKVLFERIVGDKVHEDEFRNLVDEALHKCAGLPLLIDAMAKHFKTANLSGWRDALLQIERCTNEGPSAVINKMLQLSYDHLESQDAKRLLQLCVAYGVSQPSLENLVRYGYGLGIFGKNSSIKEARDRLTTLICTLQASSLLLDSGGVYGFKIHDLVRDFVARFVLRDQPLILLKDKDMLATHLPKESTAICIPYIDMKELPEELDCPELRIFLLFNNNYSLEVPDSYFNSTKKLAVLNLTGVSLTRSQRPFQFLNNLHTLCLQSCSLEDVAILGKLKGIQILSLARSKIQQLPKEIGQLVELRLLDLNNCSNLRIIEPGVLGNLIRLEELYMENGFDQWNVAEQTPPTNASLTELNQMKNLCTLHLSISNLSVLPDSLDVEKLTNYRIRIGYMMNWLSLRQSIDRGSRTLVLKLSNVLRKGCIQSILSKTDVLFLGDLNASEQSICMLSQKGFPVLKHLEVVNSPSIHYILQSSSHVDFEKLELLILESLIGLDKICDSHVSSKSFCALKVVRVKSCEKVKVLFPLSLVRGLPQLEEIAVDDCKSMCGIIEVDDHGKLELPKLHVLKLQNLPNIKSFFIDGMASSSGTSDDQVGTPIAFFNGQQVSIPSLECLTMTGLPNLKEIWSDESPLELSNLQSIKVQQCRSLSKVISVRSLINLQKLRTLTIQSCVSMQQIFYLEGPSGSGDYPILSKLTISSLEKLEVDDCDNLRFMFLPSMVKPLAQLGDLEVSGCKKMEAIVMEEEPSGLETSETLAFPMLTKLRLVRLESLICFSCGKCSREAQSQDLVQSQSTALFNREVAFPGLEELLMSGLDNIEMIWDSQVAADSFHALKSLRVDKCNRLKLIWHKEHLHQHR